MIAPEANNHGHSSITQLRNVHLYPDELIWSSDWSKEQADDEFKGQTRFGWVTTTKSKRAIINNLANMIASRSASRFSQEDINELYTYVLDDKGATNADDNCYDDRVMAIAIGTFVIPFIDLKNIDGYSICGYCNYWNSDTRVCSQTKICRDREYWCSLHSLVDMEVSKSRGRGYQRVSCPLYRDWETDRKSTRLNSSHRL